MKNCFVVHFVASDALTILALPKVSFDKNRFILEFNQFIRFQIFSMLPKIITFSLFLLLEVVRDVVMLLSCNLRCLRTTF